MGTHSIGTHKHLIVIMDPIARIQYEKDSTLAILLAAQARHWRLSYAELDDLYWEDGEARLSLRPLSVTADPANWFQLGERQNHSPGAQDRVLMRKDPPFDTTFLYATHWLSKAQTQGSTVINHPQSLRDCNEKLFALDFPTLCPAHLVSKNLSQLRAFHTQHQDVIFKPLDGMGGQGIFRCKPTDGNLGSILEMLTQGGQRFIMAQQFIPDIAEGDKRVLMVMGQAVDYCLARIPAAGETRGNLAAGGTGRAQPLSARDRDIANTVGPWLLQKGLWFVGLDIIGDYLTEINVTSPTCIRQIDAAYGTQIGDQLMAGIEKALGLD
jgi:glutathione synthase